ncbi:fumarylacetoacetate hydrolase family protein [Granulicella tundricola]|uniref:Ureidoglycolate lyase n=1 Tax=Granulicella tundricola (strain ATCC BAA-1859 / DSM 23138 / MP5ACTX9) TaxID=1198114 RepID=E8X524_GRATM|nr:fumarylacetoacetate hydrolase family protein [Granulicella tundricola]ADW67216.1 Ureidoglycolate lyase [Granulicella tundricola MP5ACTX9]
MTHSTDIHQDVASLNARLANIQTKSGYALGLETEEGVLDLTATGAALGMSAPRDMDDLLQHGLGEQVRRIRDAVADRPETAVLIKLQDVIFAPLVTRPEKIICVGFNYEKHAEETGTPIPKAPPLFAKFSNALNHHNGVVTLPTRVDSHFDYETELVIVFGRRCRDVKEEEALDYVAGYSIGNDVSARTLQQQTTQITAGKISDGFAPVGPWLVTRDRIADPNNLRLQTFFNGERRQDWTTSDMIFDCRKLISYITGIMTIQPGDILFTGTPQGVILGEKIPAMLRRWVKPGDEVISTIEGLGELRVTYE